MKPKPKKTVAKVTKVPVIEGTAPDLRQFKTKQDAYLAGLNQFNAERKAERLAFEHEIAGLKEQLRTEEISSRDLHSTLMRLRQENGELQGQKLDLIRALQIVSPLIDIADI